MPDEAQINEAIKELQKSLANIQALNPVANTFQLNYVMRQVALGIKQALMLLDTVGIDLESKKTAWDPKEPDEAWGWDYFDEEPMRLDEKQYAVQELFTGINPQELFEEFEMRFNKVVEKYPEEWEDPEEFEFQTGGHQKPENLEGLKELMLTHPDDTKLKSWVAWMVAHAMEEHELDEILKEESEEEEAHRKLMTPYR
jgi:hypothetical protein